MPPLHVPNAAAFLAPCARPVNEISVGKQLHRMRVGLSISQIFSVSRYERTAAQRAHVHEGTCCPAWIRSERRYPHPTTMRCMRDAVGVSLPPGNNKPPRRSSAKRFRSTLRLWRGFPVATNRWFDGLYGFHLHHRHLLPKQDWWRQ